jgi:hypothetical protein
MAQTGDYLVLLTAITVHYGLAIVPFWVPA